MRIDSAILLTGVVCAALAAGVVPGGARGGGALGPVAAEAQNLGQRVVSGTVFDAASAPLAGATVFLKDLKTKSIRSFTSDAQGKFHFAQVNMVDDYDLWAEKNDKKSATKSVSSWDTRKVFDCELRVK